MSKKLSYEQNYALVETLIEACKTRGEKFGGEPYAFCTGYISGLLCEALSGRCSSADVQAHIISLLKLNQESA